MPSFELRDDILVFFSTDPKEELLLPKSTLETKPRVGLHFVQPLFDLRAYCAIFLSKASFTLGITIGKSLSKKNGYLLSMDYPKKNLDFWKLEIVEAFGSTHAWHSCFCAEPLISSFQYTEYQVRRAGIREMMPFC